MSVETFARIVFGLIGLWVAITLVRNLVTGRSGYLGRTKYRRTDARAYWGAMAMDAVLLLTCAFVAASTGQHLTPVIFAGLSASQLVQALVAGEVNWGPEQVWTPSDGAFTYWGWVIFHGVVMLLFAALLFLPAFKAS